MLNTTKKIFIFFILFFYHTYSYSDQLIIQPDEGRAPILSAIQQAKENIKLIDYGITDQVIIDNLIQAKKIGKDINILLECAPYKNENENINAINQFRAANITVTCGNPKFKFTHQKTFIFDRKTAMIMTFNLTKSTFKNERNFAITINDPEKIAEIEKVFDADIKKTNIKTSQKKLIWSPDNSREKIYNYLINANKNIEIYAEDISDYATIRILSELSKCNIQIKILHSNRNSNNKKFKFLQRAGVKLKLSKKLTIHAKIIIIDDKLAILGSINLTKNSLNNNRELAVIIDDPTIIKQLTESFELDWQATKLSHRRKKIAPAYGFNLLTLRPGKNFY